MARFTHLLIEQDRGLSIPSAELPTLSVLARRACLFVVASLAFALAPVVKDPGLSQTIPLFVLLLVLQLFPVLWPRDPDLGAPPSLGILGAVSTFGTLAGFFVAGRIELAYVGGVNPDEAASLSQRVLLASILGLSSYYVGYYHRTWGPSLSRFFPKVGGLEWDRGRIKLVALGCLLVFLACYVVFQTRLGVPLTDPTKLSEGKAIVRQDQTLTWMIRGIQLGFLPVFLFFVDAISRGKRTTALLTVLAALATAFLSIRTGIRGPAFYALQTLVIVVHYLKRRISVGLFAALLIAGVATNNLLYELRTSQNEVSIEGDSSASSASALDHVMSTLSAHESERQRFSSMALLIEQFPDNYDYLLGESWYGLVVAVVPRWLWPEKADHFMWRDSMIIYNVGGGMNPTPLLGVLYVNFSWLGILLGFLLWGAFHRGLYTWLIAQPGDKSTTLLYILTLLHFAPTMLNVSATLQYVIPMWLIIRFIGVRKPESATA